MKGIHAALYYSCLVFPFLLYLVFKKATRKRFFSASMIMYSLAVAVAGIPGLSISNGSSPALVRLGLSRGFDFRIYYIYIVFLVLTPIALALGQLISANSRVTFQVRSSRFGSKLQLLFLVLLIYAFLYFLWLPEIPIISLARGNVSTIDIAIGRNLITHGLGELKVPVLFRYWRNFIQTLMTILVLFFYEEASPTKKVILIALLLFFFVFTLEKSGFLYVVMSFVIFDQMKNEKRESPGKRAITYGLALITAFVAISLVYQHGMGEKGKTLFEILRTNVLARVTDQTSSIYTQISILDEYGDFLGVDGLDLPMIHDAKINLSKEAIIKMYPQYNSGKIAGAAGGFSVAELYFVFGNLGYVVYFFYVLLIGIIDTVYIRALETCPKNKERILCLSIYSAYSSSFALTLVSSVFRIFNPMVFFNPSVFISFFPILILVRPRFVFRKTHKQCKSL